MGAGNGLLYLGNVGCGWSMRDDRRGWIVGIGGHGWVGFGGCVGFSG